MTLLTEEAAREKWCPFARVYAVVDGDVVTVNRETLSQPAKWCRCIASGCMMWRWEAGARLDAKRDFVVQGMGEHGVGHARGFCGRAGKPEAAF